MVDLSQFGEREIQELAAIIRYFRRRGFNELDSKREQIRTDFTGTPVKNTESSIIPAYGCMQVDGMVSEGPSDDLRRYVKVKKPTSSGTLFLFNGHAAIEANGYGAAQTGPIYRVYKSTGTVTLGNRWAVTTSQYYLTKGAGPYVVVGEDAIATDVFRVVRDDVARLYRFTLNESLADGTADADILEMDGTDTGIDDTVRDPVGIFATLTAVNAAGLCLYQDGKYWVIQAACPA
jgi:hypothetical protein